MNLPDTFRVLIITLSDRAHSGEYEDISGPEVRNRINEFFLSAEWNYEITLKLIPDNPSMLKDLIINAGEQYNIIFTTGGTGIGPRDITIETVRPLLSKEIPGIMEFIRVKYGMKNPNALLSRGIAGITGRALIYTLPGSVRAVNEYLDEILQTLRHTVMMQYGIDSHKKISKTGD